jgi:hypothetical protein
MQAPKALFETPQLEAEPFWKRVLKQRRLERQAQGCGLDQAQARF